MIKTCKDLAKILMQTPDADVTVSIDDGTGLQCDAQITEVQVLDSGTISLITEEPVI
jgi:hypothetical protein